MRDTQDRQITADDLTGFKKLRRVRELLSYLHEVGCDRDKAGNRELHFDDYVILMLLYLMNPLASMAGLRLALRREPGFARRQSC